MLKVYRMAEMATITNIESLNTSHLTLSHKIVDFTPQGDVSIYDRDELNEAFEEGDLSEDLIMECYSAT
jgi:predicted RNA-binding protein associated with RNAse of E/G family